MPTTVTTDTRRHRCVPPPAPTRDRDGAARPGRSPLRRGGRAAAPNGDCSPARSRPLCAASSSGSPRSSSCSRSPSSTIAPPTGGSSRASSQALRAGARQHRRVPTHQRRHRPGTRPSTAAVGLLPGGGRRIQLYEHDGVGYLYHPHAGTLTGIVEVTSPEFLLRDPADRNARVAGWGRVLAAATRTGTVRQVHLLERSIPDDGSSLTTYTDTHLTTDPDYATLADTYRDLTGHLRGGADRHQSVPRRHHRPGQRRAHGSRPPAGRSPAWSPCGSRSSPCSPGCCPPPASTSSRTGPASDRRGHPHRLRPLRRAAHPHRTPASTPASPGRRAGGRNGILPAHRRRVPRGAVGRRMAQRATCRADFLWPVIFPPGVQRTLSLFYRPYTRAQSEAAIRAKHSEIIQSAPG